MYIKVGQDVLFKTGQLTTNFASGSYTEESDWFSSSSTQSQTSSTTTQAVGTSVGGKSIVIDAGRDAIAAAAQIIGDEDTLVMAGRDLKVNAAVNTLAQSSFTQTKESGLLDSGGFGFTIGQRSQTTDQQNQTSTAAASTIGSINGKVTLMAGNQYQQTGSDILAPNGSSTTTILAKDVQIIEARETSSSATQSQFKQSGLSISLSNPLVSAASEVQGLAQAAGNTGSTRMQALALASATSIAANAAAKAAANPAAAADITLNLSLGTSQASSNASTVTDTGRGSSLAAGGNVRITATGAGSDSNILIRGSAIKAGGIAQLKADGQVDLLAAKNESSQSNTSSSSSDSIGVSYDIFSGAVGVNASASKAQGTGSGQDVSYTNTVIEAGGSGAGSKAILQSGGDLNVKGAVVVAEQIQLKVGGNLTVESLQDASTYTSEQTSAGASISIGGSGVTGGSASAGKSSIDSTFKSVGQQSGFKAGDGGFQVEVKGTTDLKGGVITSTQPAVDENKNSFTSGGQLTTSDIENTAQFKGTAVGLSIGVGSVGVGLGSDKGDAASTTKAGISGIAGNTEVRTGDAETGLQKIFDADKAQKEINAQVAITKAFGSAASKAIGNYAQGQLDQAIANKDQAEIDKWKEGGTARVALHVVVGSLGGGIGGAAGAGTSAAAIPVLAANIANLDISLEAKAALIQGLSVAVGTAVGGSAGAAGAFNEASNNFLPALVRAAQIAQRAAQVGINKLDEASQIVLRGCAANPTCTALIQSALPAGALAWLNTQNAVQPNASLIDQIPTGYGAGGKPAPMGPTTTPVAQPIDASAPGKPAAGPITSALTPGSQTANPDAGNGAVGSGFGAGAQPVINPLTLAVPPSDRDAVNSGLAGANGGTVGRGIAYEAPSTLVQSRVDDLLTQIPANSQGRITMGVAVVEDANGVRSVVVSTSEPRGYLRPGVTLQPGEKVIAGTGHAEADIVSYANANGLKIIDIGATRPVCAGCQNTLAPTGANITTPLKPTPTPTPGKP